MLKFKVTDAHCDGQYRKIWRVIQFYPKQEVIADFENENLAHDYVDFLNDKYLDKEINAEWPPVNREVRLEYHLEEIKKLMKEVHWNEHGNGVE